MKIANYDEAPFTSNAFVFYFGVYQDSKVLTFGNSLEDALETAAAFAIENSIIDTYEPESDDDGVDLTYTEAGWIHSDDWHVNDMDYDEAIAFCEDAEDDAANFEDSYSQLDGEHKSVAL